MTTSNPFPELETPRLWLREITDADAPDLFQIHGDAERMRLFGSDPLPDLEAARALVKTFREWRTQPNPGVRWKIQRTGETPLLGTCGLFHWNRRWQKCVVGFELAREAQGQGYMGEALATVFDWGFANMALNRIEAQVHPENAASQRVLGRLGFVEEGRLRQGGYWGQRFHDLVQLGLLRDDWTRVRAEAHAT